MPTQSSKRRKTKINEKELQKSQNRDSRISENGESRDFAKKVATLKTFGFQNLVRKSRLSLQSRDFDVPSTSTAFFVDLQSEFGKT